VSKLDSLLPPLPLHLPLFGLPPSAFLFPWFARPIPFCSSVTDHRFRSLRGSIRRANDFSPLVFPGAPLFFDMPFRPFSDRPRVRLEFALFDYCKSFPPCRLFQRVCTFFAPPPPHMKFTDWSSHGGGQASLSSFRSCGAPSPCGHQATRSRFSPNLPWRVVPAYSFLVSRGPFFHPPLPS